MSFLDSITSFVKDPPPQHVFELSETGVAYSVRGQTEFERFAPGVLVPSPVEDNLKHPETISAFLARLTSSAGGKKRTPAGAAQAAAAPPRGGMPRLRHDVHADPQGAVLLIQMQAARL